MKNEHVDIDRMVMESRYLDSLERENTSGRMSDMERQGYIDEIRELKELVGSLRDTISLMRDSMEKMSASQDTSNAMVASLREKIAELTVELKSKDTRIVELEAQLRTASDRLKSRNRDLYGSRSQKIRIRQDEKKSREEEKEEDDNGRNGGRTGGDAESSPRPEKVKSEYLGDDRPEHRGRYRKMDAAKEVIHETTLDGIPSGMKFIGYKTVREYTRKSYVQCDAFVVAIVEDEYGVRHEYYRPKTDGDTAMPHDYVVPHTSCSPEFLADLVVNEYMLKVPNYRCGIQMENDRFVSSANTRKNWKHRGAEILRPLMEVLKKRLLGGGRVLNIDETWLRVRIKFRGDETKLGRYFRKYVWVLVNRQEKICYFLYDNDENDSRGHRPITRFLGDTRCAIQSDGYVVYRQLEPELPGDHILCWSHTRAKYVDADEISGDPEAREFVGLIGYLYGVDAECVAMHLSPEATRERRNRRDVTLTLERLRSRAEKLLHDMETGSYKCSEKMRQALTYMLNGWDNLLKYREDGHYTIDNFPAERAIRPFTVYRKNMEHFGSEAGVTDAMVYMTVIETLKMWGYNVKEYLERIFADAVKDITDYTQYDPAVMSLATR